MPQHTGAVALFLERQLFGRYTTRERVLSVGTTAAVLLRNNPERIGYLLVNTGTASITLRHSRVVSAGQGIVMANAGDTLSTTYNEDGDFPTLEISAIANAAGGELIAFEFIREAQSDEAQ